MLSVTELIYLVTIASLLLGIRSLDMIINPQVKEKTTRKYFLCYFTNGDSQFDLTFEVFECEDLVDKALNVASNFCSRLPDPSFQFSGLIEIPEAQYREIRTLLLLKLGNYHVCTDN